MRSLRQGDGKFDRKNKKVKNWDSKFHGIFTKDKKTNWKNDGILKKEKKNGIFFVSGKKVTVTHILIMCNIVTLSGYYNTIWTNKSDLYQLAMCQKVDVYNRGKSLT